MLKRIKIEMSWVEYINERHGKDVNISENEEKKAIPEIEEKAMEESFFINRMFFSILFTSESASVQAYANNIFKC